MLHHSYIKPELVLESEGLIFKKSDSSIFETDFIFWEGLILLAF